MKVLNFRKSIKKNIFCLLAAVGIYFVSFSGLTHAEEMPTFRQGMWEFNRSIENPNDPGKPQTMVTNRCTNPADDMKKQNEMLLKLGCKMSPVIKNGKTYIFTAECKVQNKTIESKSVMTVENDSAYNVEVESKSESKNAKEALKAHRTGDCAK